MLVAMSDMALSVDGYETETLFDSLLDRSIDIIRGDDRCAIGTEEHEQHLAIAYARLEIDDLIHPKPQQLLGGHLP